MLKYLVFFFFLVGTAFKGFGQSPVQINQPYKFSTWISVRDSLRSARGIYDLTLQLPTGCGAPSGILSLNGGDKNRAAFYYDSCNGRLFVYNPKNFTWESTNAAGSPGEIQFHAATGNGFQATTNFKYDPMFGFLTLGQPGLGQIQMSPQGSISVRNAVPTLGGNVFISNSEGYGLGINMNGPSAFEFPSNAHVASAKGLILSGVDSTRISSTPALTADYILGVVNQEGTYGTGKLVRIAKPTWAQTLAASPDLTAPVYSDGGGNSFVIDNTSDFAFYALDPGTNNFSAVEGYSGFTGLTAQNDATNGQASISANADDGEVPNFQLHTSLVGSSNRASDWLGKADGYNMINVHNNPTGRKSFYEQFATDSITGHRLTTYHTNGNNRFSITDTLFKFERNRSDLPNLDFRLINLPRSTSNTDSVLVKDAAGRIYSRSQSEISVTPGGSEGNVQFNKAGTLGGSSTLNFEAISNVLQISGDGTTDNGAIVIHNPIEGDAWYSHSNVILHNNDATLQPGISISNNLNKTLSIINPGGMSDPGIYAEDSLHIQASRRFDISGGKLVLRGLDSLMMQVTPSASADSLLGVVNLNELDKTNKVVKFPKPRQFVHWSQWLMNNISGTTFELSCLREGAGSVTIPKNTSLTGDTYRITMMGDVSTDATTPGQLTLRITLGNQLVATTNALELPAGINQRGFEVDLIVTLWIPTSIGLAYGRGFWKDESGAMKRFDNGLGGAQLDFTNDLDWNITAQWSNDSVGNALRPFIVSIVQEN